MRRYSEIVLVIALMLYVALTGDAWAQDPVMALDPPNIKNLESGESFSVNVTITNATNVYGWQSNITFDPSVLSVEKVTEGPFLKNVNETIWPTPSINNDRGFVMFCSSFDVPYPVSGANGDGMLATIECKVKSGGSTSLKFVTGTYMRTIGAGSPPPLLPIDLNTQDGSFTGTGGAGLGLPLEIIAGVAAVVLVVVVAGVFFLKRRR